MDTPTTTKANDARLRQRLAEARAAIDRAARAFANEPEYDMLHEARESFDFLRANVHDRRQWGVPR